MESAGEVSVKPYPEKHSQPSLFFNLPNQCRRRGGAADHDALEAAQIVIVALRANSTSAVAMMGTRLQACTPSFSISRKTSLAIETLDHHVLSAEQREEMRYSPAVCMKQRNGVQFHGTTLRMESQSRCATRGDIHFDA